MDKALKYGACDSVTMDAREAFKDADLIVVCTPVSKIPGTVVSALKISGTDAVITDAGSTKSCIVKAVEKAIKGRLRYVGSHPMAGSEKKGVPFASKDLFKGAVCVLTPTSRTERAAYSVIKAMWQALGARCVDLDPVEHDRVMSEISHMPHIIAASVAGTPERKSLRFAATGFCDTTRIAASDPELWADIFSDNRKELLLAIKKFTKI
jgi:prephenate dehydrogenase